MLGRLQRARRKVLDRTVDYRAVLGDSSGNVYAGDGLYWVRPYDAASENNVATLGAAYRVQAGSALIVPRAGRVVWIGYGPDRRLTVKGYDHNDLVSAGINPTSIQPNDPYREWIRFKNIQNFRALPISTANSPNMKVEVRQLFYYTHTGDLVRWNGTNAATHIDLSSYVPASDLQRYVVLWLRTYNPNGESDIQVTASSTISSVNDVLSFEELQECADTADADTIPIQAFRLANAQTSLKIDDTIDVDLRQLINVPQIYGFPNTVARAYRVHEDFSVVMPSAVMVETGGVVQIQDNALLMILGDEEENSGGGGGGGGGMTSFTVAGDTGTPQTISDGDTLSIAGGDGIASVASATDTVTVSVDSTVIRTTGTQSIGTGLTIDTPTIANFTNAQHDHTDADDGGQLTDAALSSPVGIAKGGTGQTTQTAAFDALAPTTTQGDTIYHNGTDNVRLAKGTAKYHYKMNSGATAPEWAAGVTIDFQAFTSPGSTTWTKPAGAFFVDVICIGGGGGGGAGRRGGAAAARCGGGGGAPGSVTRMRWAASQLGSSETVVVGNGGNGGTASVVDNTNGGDGGTGGLSYFGGSTSAAKLVAMPGVGGTGGSGVASVAGGAGQTTLSTTYQFYESSGGNGSSSGPGGTANAGQWGPGGGGGGGGITSGGTAANGGAGASGSLAAYYPLTAGGGGTAGTTVSGTGGAGANGTTNGTSTAIFGAGGGGGAADTTIGRAGGAGGTPGGGGGGAAGNTNGTTGGSGGTGGAGGVIVISYCY